MKALTVRQPWASLIALGVKTIETRSWNTSYRGLLAIHAGKKSPEGMIGSAVGNFIPWYSETVGGYVMGPNEDTDDFNHLDVFDLPLGVIVATCELLEIVPMEKSSPGAAIGPSIQLWTDRSDRERADYASKYSAHDVTDQVPYGDFAPGRFAWILGNMLQTIPLPAKGRQGLWEWTL